MTDPDPTHPDALLQAFRLVNPGQFHRELIQIHRDAETGDAGSSAFMRNLADVLSASKREPSPHASKDS